MILQLVFVLSAMLNTNRNAQFLLSEGTKALKWACPLG